MTVAWGTNRTFGVFLKPMLSEFGWSRASISGAFTMAMIIMGLASFVGGRITDRFGPRAVVISCGLCLGAGYFFAATVRAIWQFYIFYGLMTGIGLSATTPLMSLVASCKTNRVEPWAYLRDVLTKLPSGVSPAELLPDVWLRQQPKHRWTIADQRADERLQPEVQSPACDEPVRG